MPLFQPSSRVSLDTNAAATQDYVARAKESADTFYRVQLGIDANDRGSVYLGGGSATFDLRLRRASGAGTLTIDGAGASNDTFVQVRGTFGFNAKLDLGILTEGVSRITLDATQKSLAFSDGTAAIDAYIYRVAAKTVRIDADFGGAAMTLDVRGAVNLATNWTTTKPATPASGVSQYSNHIVNASWPSAVLTSGNDFPFDIAPWMFITYQIADGNGTNIRPFRAPALSNVAVSGLAGTLASGGTIGTGSYQAAHPWVKHISNAAAGSVAVFSEADNRYFLGNAANMGGFYCSIVFTLSKAASTGDRIFVGLSATVLGLANTDPSALLNLCGVSADAGDTANLQFMHNGSSGTGVKTDLGANFTKASTTNVYQLEMWAAPNTATPIYWAVSRRDVTNVTPQTGNFSASIVAVNTQMGVHLSRWNAATAVTCEVGLYSIVGWMPG